MSFWAMGGYAGFIWPAYGVSALALIAAAVWTLKAYGDAKARLKALEEKDVKRLIYILPVAGFAVLAFFMFRSLVMPSSQFLPSALIDKPAPARVLPALDAETQGFGPKELASGKVTVINVFSSTCVPCRVEAPVLNRLAARLGMTLYGFVWEDQPENARKFLDEVGNPFSRIGLDTDGSIGREWGVYGWPETYVVDGHGIIRLKIVGGLTDQVVTQQLLPAIEKAKLAS